MAKYGEGTHSALEVGGSKNQVISPPRPRKQLDLEHKKRALNKGGW